MKYLLHSLLLAGMVSLASGMALAADQAEQLPAGTKLARIEVSPAAIELNTRYGYAQLILTGVTDSGERIDVTRIAAQTGTSPLVNLSAEKLVSPISDGEGQLSFALAGQTVNVPVKISGTKQPFEASFVRDVMPIMSKMGCNAGTCHGAQDGKNGFKLSLRGYDPQYDHEALTEELGARRFNRAAPDQSLMLLKATGSIPHVGGVRTTSDARNYHLMRSWIASGVKLDLNAPRVTKIEILPKDPIVSTPGMKQQMRVIATYADGLVRDVTADAFIESSNLEVVEADGKGLLTTVRRGESAVLARYEGNYAASTVIVMGDRTGFVWQQPPTYNYIDELVYKKLERVKVLPAELCDDSEFARRVYLDLTGLPPTIDEIRAFLSDKTASKEKRDALVDKLVGSPAFVEHWTNKWADMLHVNRKVLGEAGAASLRAWIRQQVAANTPYDKFARSVITASGSNLQNPPASYYKAIRDPADLMENTTHLFLAVRFNCNKCHDHPFERWTQDQYYHMSAYFSQVKRKEDPGFAGKKLEGTAVEAGVPLVEVIYDTKSGDMTHQRTGKISAPEFPYQHDDLLAGSANRREQLAQWIVSPKNQYFAKSYVNRLWGYLFGIGIIEPIDDIRAGNPASNPALLDALTADFIKSNFDVQHMFKTICKSRAYQHSVRSTKWNNDDTINYARSYPKRLPAEVLFDAIHQASGSTPRLPGIPAGFRAAQLPDSGSSNPFLDDFGRPPRESSCECERTTGIVLGPIMKLINGPTVASALSDPGNALTKLAASNLDDKQVVEELFLRFLGRTPTEQEVALSLEALQGADQDRQKLVARVAEAEKNLPARQAEWEKNLSAEVKWQPLEIVEMKSKVGAKLEKRGTAIFVSGALDKDTYTIVADTDLTGITGFKLEALPDDALGSKGPGRSENGNFVLNEFTVTAAPKKEPTKAAAVTLQSPTADFNQQSWHVAGLIDGDEATGWAIHPEAGKPHFAQVETSADIGQAGGTRLTFALLQQYQDGKHLLGHFRILATTSRRPLSGGAALPANIVSAGAKPADKRTPEEQKLLSDYYRAIDAELIAANQALGGNAQSAASARLLGVQDIAWALINSPAFLFNR